MSVNVNKCNHVSYGEKDNLGTDYYYISTNNIKYVIQKVNHIKDLGVTFDTHLSFQEHMQVKINKAYSWINQLHPHGLLHFLLIIQSLSKTAFRICAFCLVSIQKRRYSCGRQKSATKLIISLKTLPYKERLRKLKLSTLKYRRLRGI